MSDGGMEGCIYVESWMDISALLSCLMFASIRVDIMPAFPSHPILHGPPRNLNL